MKHLLFSKALYAFLIPVAMLFSFTTVISKTNFSGEWKLDEAKSDLGNFAAFAARTIKAEQKDSSITISRTTAGFNGGDPITSTVTLFYDGRVTESEGFGGSKIKSTGKWSDDGQSFIINSVFVFDMNGQSNEVKITETWTLTKEGLLSLVTNSTSPNGDASTTAIYNK
jgi:hypothetical protein